MTNLPLVQLSTNDLAKIIRIARLSKTKAQMLDNYLRIIASDQIDQSKKSNLPAATNPASNLKLEDVEDPVATDTAGIIADVPANLANMARAIYAVVEGGEEEASLPLALQLSNQM